MSKFIELTQYKSNKNILINTENIIAVYDNYGTTEVMVEGNLFHTPMMSQDAKSSIIYVKESYKEVCDKIWGITTL